MSLPSTAHLRSLADAALAACGAAPLGAGQHSARTPITGATLGGVAAPAEVDLAIERADAAFRVWRTVPGPVRGELVRRFGEELRRHKDDLATLVQLEAGKIRS